LKPEWTFRWLLDPAQIAPGTAMPTGLFRKDQDHWVVNLPNPPADVSNYHGDHARLLVRYMFLMTPDEQQRLLSASPAPPPAAASPPQTPQKTGRNRYRTPSGSEGISAAGRRWPRERKTLAQLRHAHRVARRR
jgi:hypothetical protein